MSLKTIVVCENWFCRGIHHIFSPIPGGVSFLHNSGNLITSSYKCIQVRATRRATIFSGSFLPGPSSGQFPKILGLAVNHEKIPMRNKQWRKHHGKDLTTANRMRCFFFFEAGNAVWPREFHHFVSRANSHGKIPVAIPRFLSRKIKIEHCRSIRRGLVFLMGLQAWFFPHW